MLDRARIDSDTPETAPSHDDVQAALERIVSSSEFRCSPHLAAFLRFSVEKSLSGEGFAIKAYSVATGVLGRPPTFDPQADPIVRVEATRLRRAIERYYLHEGADDPVLIDIPRGRYIAFFSYRSHVIHDQSRAIPGPISDIENDEVDATTHVTVTPKISDTARHAMHRLWSNLNRSERRSVAIFAFALMGAIVTWGIVPSLSEIKKPIEQALILQSTAPVIDNAIASLATNSISSADMSPQRVTFAGLQLTPFDSYTDNPEHNELSHRLTHLIAERAPEFDGIPVFDPDGPIPAETPKEHLYALLGTILQESKNPERVEISLRLVQRPSYEIVWTKTYSTEESGSLFDQKLIDIRDDIVQSISGLHGAIRVDDARRHIDEKSTALPCQICLAESDLALRTENPEQIAHAITCLSAMATKKPNEPLIYKQLAALRLALKEPAEARVKNITLAMADLEKAIRLSPDDRQARLTLLQLQSARANRE